MATYFSYHPLRLFYFCVFGTPKYPPQDTQSSLAFLVLGSVCVRPDSNLVSVTLNHKKPMCHLPNFPFWHFLFSSHFVSSSPSSSAASPEPSLSSSLSSDAPSSPEAEASVSPWKYCQDDWTVISRSLTISRLLCLPSSSSLGLRKSRCGSLSVVAAAKQSFLTNSGRATSKVQTCCHCETVPTATKPW